MSRRARCALLLALVPAACAAGTASAPARGPSAVVSGKVTRSGEGVDGARVFAFAGFEAFLARRAAAASEPTGADGVFCLPLPPGTWYLFARRDGAPEDGPPPPGALYSFPGSNPFTLTPGARVEANFSLARKGADPLVVPGEDPGSGTLGGVVTWEGQPLQGVSVKLYLDAETDFRGMGYATAPPTDESGAFRFEYLPESLYYVVARRRSSGPGEGPIGEGDHYGWCADNPVPVRAGTAVSVELEMVSKSRAVGNADTRPRPSGTAISGRILDARGAAAKGVHAFAYEEKVMSHKKPAFLSAEAGADGRYVLYLSRGGTFYVGARSGYGDSPAKGEWYGLYDGSADHGVTVEAGERRDGVDIVVERILLP